VILTPEEREAILRQATEEYPHEACGVVLVRGGERQLLPCRNAQNELHARDPQRHPRDARTAYYIADADRLAMVRLEGQGFRTAVIYHSHIDAGAYFSEADRRQALLGEEPMYPEATYVVVSVVNRQVEAIGAFRWDPARQDFAPASFQGDGAESAPASPR